MNKRAIKSTVSFIELYNQLLINPSSYLLKLSIKWNTNDTDTTDNHG